MVLLTWRRTGEILFTVFIRRELFSVSLFVNLLAQASSSVLLRTIRYRRTHKLYVELAISFYDVNFVEYHSLCTNFHERRLAFC